MLSHQHQESHRIESGFRCFANTGKRILPEDSKTYRWMLDGRESRTYIKCDLKGWRHRSICFFGVFDRLFDVSATHCDVFSYTSWCVSSRKKTDIWNHPNTPFLHGVPGNVEEWSNITARCFQPGFPDVMVFAGPESNEIRQSVCHDLFLENNTGSDQPNMMISQVWMFFFSPDLLKSLKWKLRAFVWFIVEQKTTSIALYIGKRNQSAYFSSRWSHLQERNL